MHSANIGDKPGRVKESQVTWRERNIRGYQPEGIKELEKEQDSKRVDENSLQNSILEDWITLDTSIQQEEQDHQPLKDWR